MIKIRTLVIIIAAALILSLAASAIIYFTGGSKTANIYVDGQLYRSIDLNAVAEPMRFTVKTASGSNVIEVERGRIRVAEADCPDKVCEKFGWLEIGGLPIVCLPHGLCRQWAPLRSARRSTQRTSSAQAPYH